MEALASLGIDWKLLIAQIANFLILLLILSKFLYKPLVNMLEQRKEKIAQGIKDSEAAGVKLSEAEGESKKIISQAITKANDIIEKAKKEAEIQAGQITDKAKQRAGLVLAKADESAKLREAEVMKGVRGKIADIVGIAFEKITKENVSSQNIDKAISELK